MSTTASDGRRHPLALRTFDIPTSATSTITVRITEPSLVADNLPLETWASSSILAAELGRHPIEFPRHKLISFTSASTHFSTTTNTDTSASHAPGPTSSSEGPIVPVLELGAGTGLVGMTAAHVYAQPVVLTDLPPIVPGLWANIALNLGSSSILDGRVVRAGVLDWTAPDALVLPPPPGPESNPNAPANPAQDGQSAGRDRPVVLSAAKGAKAHVLLAADTLYSEEHPALLAGVVRTWLSRSREARLVLGTALRVAYLDEINELWKLLEEAGMECVHEGRGEAEARDFDDERLVEWSFWRWREGV